LELKTIGWIIVRYQLIN